MKKLQFILFSLSMLLIASSCRKDPMRDLSAADSRVYITEYDSSANFTEYQSFRVGDSVTVIENGRYAGRGTSAFDRALVQAVTAAMLQKGYQLESNHSVKPDIGINITRITTDYTGVVSYNNYWGGYGGYWDPFYWGYGGYDYFFPYSFGVYSVTEGAVSIDMLDLRNPDSANNRLKTVWTGLARGTGIFNSANIPEMVQAMFNQSAYLQQ
jgi:Domain of unknown function (DUF4136)